MIKSIKSRLISFLLVVALVFSLLFASAIPTNAVTDISPGESGKSKVVTTVAPSIFSVTVPYVLPITIDKDQNVYVADNAAITNNSNGPIIVSSAEITAKNGWELVDSSTDFQAVPVNSKKLTLSMMREPVDVSGSVDTSLFSSINGNSSLIVSYDADAAVQGDALTTQNVADVLFTVEWDSYELSGDIVNKTALNTFAKSNNLKTFQRTTENLNIDDVLADSRMVKVDNAPVISSGASRGAIASGTAEETDPVIYAWSDDNGNGYWWSNADKVYLPSDCSGMFMGSTLTELDLCNFDTSNVTNMSNMFRECSKLTSLDLSSFNTSNVTSMMAMFENCTSLTSLNICNFDTRNVTDMQYMFDNCSKLKSLNISNFDTGNVEFMSGMFSNLNVSTLNLSSFDTRNVTRMQFMFKNCLKLTSLDLSSFNTSNVIDMQEMFYGCSNVTSLDLSSFASDKLYSMLYMFNNCSNLTTIYVSNFNGNTVTQGSSIFNGCSKLVGQNGTTYNSRYTDKTYACIDTPETPGYFTYKAKAAA